MIGEPFSRLSFQNAFLKRILCGTLTKSIAPMLGLCFGTR